MKKWLTETRQEKEKDNEDKGEMTNCNVRCDEDKSPLTQSGFERAAKRQVGDFLQRVLHAGWEPEESIYTMEAHHWSSFCFIHNML